eukprot:Skav222848  [mRNA]  locus=scaffold850:173131:176044:- [translate_table: standard]
MVDVGDLVLRKDSGLAVDAAADATALGTEVFQALQVTATEAWGEGWLSESTRAHLAILGGEDDWDSAQLCKTDAGGVVAALFELLTEQLSMPRVSVVLGGAAVLHREAEKRGIQDRLRGLLSGGADRASRAFASLRQKAKQAVDAVDTRDPQFAPAVHWLLHGMGAGAVRKSIVYTDLIAVLTAAVRDFGSEVEAVKKRMALAEAALEELEKAPPPLIAFNKWTNGFHKHHK